MLRIFVTGDQHLGLKYANHEKGELLARRRVDAFGPMVEEANRARCDLFVITGDLFENHAAATRRMMTELLDHLAAFQGTVVILPGNHDYYDPDSKLWQQLSQLLSQRDNVLLLTQPRPYALQAGEKQVVLYPAVCTTRHSAPGENALGWIKQAGVTPDAVFRLGLAHGAVEGETIDSEGRYFLMTRQELESVPVDAWLLGHTHVPFPAELTDEFRPADQRIFNPGTHVQTDVNCNTPGLCFLLELEEGEGQKPLRARRFRSGTLRFFRRKLELRPGGLRQTLQRVLSALDADSVVELELTGAVNDEEYDNRHEIMKETLSPFLEGSWNDRELSRQITGTLIDREFAETSFCAGLLRQLLPEPKEAQLAYELIKSLQEGKS